jgi:hypothetical protein
LWIDQFYRNNIGKRLKILTSIIYDDSDADHTITAGIGTLPSDFLMPSRVYDGDTLLTQITDIDDKIDDDEDPSKYIILNNSQFRIFGATPTDEITLWYYAKPAALTDNSASSPSDLKEEFHLDPFITLIQKIYESRKRKYSKAINLEVWMAETLDNIEEAHTSEMRDDSPKTIKVEW